MNYGISIDWNMLSKSEEINQCVIIQKNCWENTKSKRHWCIEQSFGLCGRGKEGDDLGEWHWNMYNI